MKSGGQMMKRSVKNSMKIWINIIMTTQEYIFVIMYGGGDLYGTLFACNVMIL
jgi:hypothetical protein